MSRNRNRKPQQQAQASAPHATGDSFRNLMTRTGVGQGNGNASTGSGYDFTPISRNRTELEFAYRSSWIVGQAVDTVAEDMTREGVEIHSDMKPEDIKRLEQEATRLGVWDKLCDTIKWARLYGGALGFLMIDGQDPATPLRLETVAKGQFRGILDLDRWSVQPDLTNLVKEYGPDYGKPMFYTMIQDAAGLQQMRIHHSRVIRIEAVDLPYWQRITENGWGQSVVERLWDRLVAFDSTTQGAAQLVYKAHLRTYKVKGLRDIIAAGGKAFEGLVKQIDMIRAYQSNEGLTLMDGEDEFEAHQYSFSGLSDMMLQFGQQISGALQIPLVRLFGQSPSGMNSTGESDLRTYYDGVKKEQERRLRTGIERVYRVMHLSVFGQPAPDGFALEFKPLWQMSDEQKAKIATDVTTAVVGAYDSQMVSRATALKELKQSAEVTGIWSNITAEEITEAENEPEPPRGEGLELPDVETANAGQAEEAKQPG